MLPSLPTALPIARLGLIPSPLTAWLPLSVLLVIVTVEPERTMMPPPWPRPAKLNAGFRGTTDGPVAGQGAVLDGRVCGDDGAL